MKRKIAQLGKKAGLEENELRKFFRIGLSGLIAVALSVFTGLAQAGGSDGADLQHLIDKPQAKENLPEECKLKPEQGPCKGFFWKYYFNQKTNTCEEFMYGGCEGVVPFETKDECEKACLGQKTEPIPRDNK